MIALTFATPLLLIGLLAGAIPLLLHLISSVRAREQYFPTLRFLRLTMEKTARRRRLQNWLLLILRSLALATLAMAVAEPISEATGGWLGGSGQAAVVVLDNSFSMAATPAESNGAESINKESLFARARADASSLLSGENKPHLAALATVGPGANLPSGPRELTAQLDLLRQDLAHAAISFGPPSLTENIAAAAETLSQASTPDRSLYVMTDGQRVDLNAEDLRNRLAGIDTAGLHVFVVRKSNPRLNNAGVTDLQLAGPAIVDSPVEILATLTNASPQPRNIEVELSFEGHRSPQRIMRTLAPAGEDGSETTVTFRHRFTTAGPAAGEVRILTDDDLPVDNVRHLAVNVADRVRALVVQPPTTPNANRAFDPAVMLQIALDWRDPLAAQDPWPIRSVTASAPSLTPDELNAADAAFFCEAASFDQPTAQTLTQFVRRGGTAVFFMGPAVDAANYNARFGGAGGLLPGTLGDAVGQVGLDAKATAVAKMDVEHPLLSSLFDRPADYPTVLVQRYLRLDRPPTAGRVLMELADGSPLIVEQPFGDGRAIWCMTTASPRWANLSTSAAGVFVPMVVRAALQSAAGGKAAIYDAGSLVTIDVNTDLPGVALPPYVEVALPRRSDGEELLRLEVGKDGLARFSETQRPGLYRWTAKTPDGQERSGRFAVNPWGPESRLTPLSPDELTQTLNEAGFENVYVGASLDEVHDAAAERAIGRNWWDLLAAAVIILLIAETLIANRRKAQDLTPEHLNPTVQD